MDVLKSFAKFTLKHLRWDLLSPFFCRPTVYNWIKRKDCETNAFLCFTKHLTTIVFEVNRNFRTLEFFFLYVPPKRISLKIIQLDTRKVNFKKNYDFEKTYGVNSQ